MSIKFEFEKGGFNVLPLIRAQIKIIFMNTMALPYLETFREYVTTAKHWRQSVSDIIIVFNYIFLVTSQQCFASQAMIQSGLKSIDLSMRQMLESLD